MTDMTIRTGKAGKGRTDEIREGPAIVDVSSYHPVDDDLICMTTTTPLIPSLLKKALLFGDDKRQTGVPVLVVTPRVTVPLGIKRPRHHDE